MRFKPATFITALLCLLTVAHAAPLEIWPSPRAGRPPSDRAQPAEYSRGRRDADSRLLLRPVKPWQPLLSRW